MVSLHLSFFPSLTTKHFPVIIVLTSMINHVESSNSIYVVVTVIVLRVSLQE